VIKIEKTAGHHVGARAATKPLTRRPFTRLVFHEYVHRILFSENEKIVYPSSFKERRRRIFPYLQADGILLTRWRDSSPRAGPSLACR